MVRVIEDLSLDFFEQLFRCNENTARRRCGRLFDELVLLGFAEHASHRSSFGGLRCNSLGVLNLTPVQFPCVATERGDDNKRLARRDEIGVKLGDSGHAAKDDVAIVRVEFNAVAGKSDLVRRNRGCQSAWNFDMPIRIGGETVGTINLSHDEGFFSERHLPLAGLIAGIVAARFVWR